MFYIPKYSFEEFSQLFFLMNPEFCETELNADKVSVALMKIYRTGVLQIEEQTLTNTEFAVLTSFYIIHCICNKMPVRYVGLGHTLLFNIVSKLSLNFTDFFDVLIKNDKLNNTFTVGFDGMTCVFTSWVEKPEDIHDVDEPCLILHASQTQREEIITQRIKFCELLLIHY